MDYDATVTQALTLEAPGSGMRLGAGAPDLEIHNLLRVERFHGGLVGCHADFEGPFFPLSHWERVRVRGFASPVGPLTPALSRWEREKAQPASSITCTVMEH